MSCRTQLFFTSLLLCCLFTTAPLWAEEINPQNPVMGMYTKPPALLASGAQPSVMLMLDNSGSMYRLAYRPHINSFVPDTEYYGLFKPKSYYRYNDAGEFFERCEGENPTDAECAWNGNFLNWLTMRRIDISKKVLTGGRLVQQGDTTLLTAEPDPDRDLGNGRLLSARFAYNDRIAVTDLNGNTRHMTPYRRNYLRISRDLVFVNPTTGHAKLRIRSGVTTRKEVNIEIKIPADEVPTIKGIIQETGTDVRYGLTVFEQPRRVGDGRSEDAEGGVVRQYIGAGIQQIVDSINSTTPITWTPLAETLHTVTGYFAQNGANGQEQLTFIDNNGTNTTADISVGPRYNGENSYQINNTWDPFYFNEKQQMESCSKAFVIVLTDGLPTKDISIPNALRDFDADTQDAAVPQFRSYATDYLDDVARYAHTTDLRPDLDGMQNLTIYPIFVFGNSPTPPQILIDAAENGGFDLDTGEIEKDPITDLPHNLFNARNGNELVTALRTALTNIKDTTSSAASVAVMNSSTDGSGATFQSIYFPSMKDDNGHMVAWTGDVHALLIDSYGNLREDSNHNQQLDMVDDLIIKSATNSDGQVVISMFKDHNGNGLLEPAAEVETTDADGNPVTIIVDETVEEKSGLSLDDVAYLWSGGNWLSHIDNNQIETQRSSYISNSSQRYIYTYIDRNNNGRVDIGEYLPFTTEALAANENFFGYFLGTNSGDGRDFNSDTEVNTDDLAILINYIRGKEFESETYPKLRSRKYESQLVLGQNGVDLNAVWRLGDVVSSSPIAVQTPFAGYDTTYNSKSYRKFKRKYAERRTMVYTGSNDGIFHAFNGGFYQKDYADSTVRVYNKFWKYCEKDDVTGDVTCSDSVASAPDLGQEMWAYIPQNLLPQLQWLPQKDYQHIFYNDLPPTILEAQLWNENDPVHVGGWGTLLVGGMRFGGGPIEVEAKVLKPNGLLEDEKRIMRSAYFVMDITDPELPPVLLDEFTLDIDDRANFTTVQPSLEYVTINAEEERRDWYLVFGSGPETLQGESRHRARVFVRKLAALPIGAGQTISTQQYAEFGTWMKKPPIAAGEFHLFEVKEENSFIGNFFGADFHVGSGEGSFSTDAIYFGTIAGQFNLSSGEADQGEWTGKMHRIVVESGNNNPADTATWEDKILFDAQAPISIKPQVTLDDIDNAWVFFGTGRFIEPLYDKEDINPKMSLYGIKEAMVNNARLGMIPNYMGDQIVAGVNKDELLDSTNIKVYAGPTASASQVRGAGATVNNFAALEMLANTKQGWLVELAQENQNNISTKGERIIVNPVIYNQLINFNSFIPSTNICEAANAGYVYDFYYKTGTAFWKPIMTVDESKSVTVVIDGQTVTQYLSIPSLWVASFLSSSSFFNGEGGTEQVIGSDRGGIKKFPITPPGPYKSGRLFWVDKRE